MASISTRAWNNKDGTKSERHQVTYRDAAGVRARKDFETKRGAKRFVESLSEHRKEQALKSPNMMRSETFADAAKAFLKACEQGRDGGSPLENLTQKEYRRRIDQHLIPLVGERLVAALTVHDIRDARDALIAKDLAKVSTRKHLFLLKSILKHAMYLGWIEVDPSVGVVIKIDKRREAHTSRAIKIHTREEMASILSTARNLRVSSPVWDQNEAIIQTMVYAGLRMSELRGLPCEAFDPIAQTLQVFQRADMEGQIGPPKSRSGFRTIAIPTGLAQRLKEVMGDRKEGLIFPTRTGKPINHSNIANRVWLVAQKEAEVSVLNPHSARHFYASMLIRQGMRMKDLQDTMGHHDPMFTMKVYGHLFRDPEDVALRRAMATRMEQALTPDED